ncbi:LPO_1073/Vpar_1526 family protein [Parapedobacter sp. 2B3]|uniref:LPO_1073/Vpar_1526 family protein n=1 Tax=Parapedobacter sp. 2B3 TaxID=3342381 RepID=UPI0035B6919A
MLNDKIQKQEGGDSSTNLQGQVVNVYQGISYADAKEIALDVFSSNFIQLKNEAAEIAKHRAEEITEALLEKLIERAPDAIQEFKQPGMQDSLFTAQKEYAKSGDRELGDLLVDILVDRANSPKRNMMQIILDEALRIAPKLTIEQLDTITLSFLLTRTVRRDVNNLERFGLYITKYILPFVDSLTAERSDYNYIEYLGCGQIRAGNYGQLENKFLHTYKAVFQEGFSKEDFEMEVGQIDSFRDFIISCFHNPTLFQLNALNDSVLEEIMTAAGVDEDIKKKLQGIFNKSTMKPSQVKEYIVGIDSNLNKIFEVWENTPMINLELTSVGIAIAHSNYRRRIGDAMNLSKWIK